MMYRIEAQGYGGFGPSVRPMTTSDLNAVREEIADLIESDHAVQLYKVNTDGSKTRIDFECRTTVTVDIEDE